VAIAQTKVGATPTVLQWACHSCFCKKKSKNLLSNGLANELGIFVNLAKT
jgi:hypothetical protein